MEFSEMHIRERLSSPSWKIGSNQPIFLSWYLKFRVSGMRWWAKEKTWWFIDYNSWQTFGVAVLVKSAFGESPAEHLMKSSFTGSMQTCPGCWCIAPNYRCPQEEANKYFRCWVTSTNWSENKWLINKALTFSAGRITDIPIPPSSFVSMTNYLSYRLLQALCVINWFCLFVFNE